MASGSHLPPALPEAGGEEDEKELYCLCQQPYNVDTSESAISRCLSLSSLRAGYLRMRNNNTACRVYG